MYHDSHLKWKKLLKRDSEKYSSLLINIICRKALFKLCENCIRYHDIVLPWENAKKKLALKRTYLTFRMGKHGQPIQLTLNQARWLWPFFQVFTSRQYIALYMYPFNQTLYIYLLSPSCKSINDLHYKHKLTSDYGHISVE